MAATIALPSTLVAESGSGTRLRLWPEWLTLCLYAAIVAYAIPFHEPWADEAQAWQMARALSVHDLFFHALRYEGSPGLWHLLLHGLIRLHVSYTAMHWLTGLVAVCGMSLFIFFAPFPRWFRLILPFSVFFAFQYAVVARSYVLAPLLAFAAAIFWKRNAVLLAIMLGLLANTSLHGFALAAALGIVYFVETRRGLHEPNYPRIALLILVAFLAFALLTALPTPPDLTFDDEVLRKPLGEHLAASPFLAFAFLLRAFAHPWQLALPLVLATLWLAYRIGGKLYLLPLLSVAMLSGLGYWNYWHLGFASLALITTAWIAWRPLQRTWNWPVISIVAIWLALQIGSSVFAFVWDHAYAYSPDKAAAKYLTHFVDNGLPIALTVANKSEVGAFHSVGLGPYFDHPIFINQQRLYWVWTTHEHTQEQLNAALDQNPAAIVAMFYRHDNHRFDRSRDLDIRRLHPLYERGYGVTQVFCGEKPEDFGLREEICEIVLER
jgi:hypothetical protein